MALEKFTTTKLGFPGGHARWEVTDAMVLDVGGDQFLKLPRMGVNSGFTRLVVEGLKTKPLEGFSLTWSVGYKQLMSLRNSLELDRVQDAAQTDNAVSEFFKKYGNCESKTRAAKTTRETMQKLKDNPETMTMQIPAYGDQNPLEIVVKRPVTVREELVVAYDESTIEAIIKFLRHEGFDESLARDKELPTGVYAPKRSGKRSVKSYEATVNVAGTTKKKRMQFDSIEAAIEAVEHGVPEKDTSDSGPQVEDGAPCANESNDDDASEEGCAASEGEMSAASRDGYDEQGTPNENE